MPKAKLDAAFVAAAQCQPGAAKTDWYDEGGVTGFVLECRSSGGKTYYLRYQDQAGRQRQHKIGKVQDLPFAAARKLAQRLRADVVMGGDPGAKKAEAKAVPIYRELSGQCVAFARTHLKSYDTVEMVHRVHILPRWAKVRLTDIDTRSVGLWLAEKRAGGLSPASVEKIRVIFGRSFELGSQWGIPGCEKNPTRGLPRKPINNARQRYLSAEEAARLREAVAASNNPQLQHIVGLLLLTGARLRELLDARWEHVDLERRSWLIPTSKSGRSRFVPLSSPAVEIIQALPRFKGCAWLVPNPDTLVPFVSIKRSWQQAIKRARLSNLRLHDLRHSAASFMVAAGVPLFTVGKVLGHANVASTARYSHLGNDALLAAVEAGAAKQAG